MKLAYSARKISDVSPKQTKIKQTNERPTIQFSRKKITGLNPRPYGANATALPPGQEGRNQ